MNKKEVIKPSTILKDEYINNLTNLTNNSGLPLFVIEYILKDFIQEVHVTSKKQTLLDMEKYEEQLKALQNPTEGD